MDYLSDPRFDYCRSAINAINTEQHTSLISLFDLTCAEHTDRAAYNCLGQDVRFSEIEAKSRAFAAWLQTLGLEAGDRVAVQLPNLIQYPIVAWGVIRAGMTLVNTNPLYTQHELKHQLNDSGARVIVMLSDFLAAAEATLADTPVEQVVVTNVFDMMEAQPAPPHSLGNDIQLSTLPDALIAGESLNLTPVEANLDSLAILQYTGGTTGVAKGAMLTHGNVLASTLQAQQHMEEAGDEDDESILIAPLPIYHIFGFSLYVVSNFAIGGRSVLIPDPRDSSALLQTMQAFPFTGFAGVNTMFVALMADPLFDSVDWSHLKASIAGGAALVPEVAREWQRRTGSPILEGYGLSETAASLTCNTRSAARLGTVGTAMGSQQIKLADSEGKPVAAGEEGELCVRGAQVMVGYWNRPDETDKAIDAEGYFRTGDIAVQTEDGYYRIVDRIKDMILVSGFNVYPNEIEAVVFEHPDIVECAVVARKDEKSGEAVALYAVSSNPDLTSEDLRKFCRQKLTNYKVPKFVYFEKELPKSNVGKVLRRELRDRV